MDVRADSRIVLSRRRGARRALLVVLVLLALFHVYLCVRNFCAIELAQSGTSDNLIRTVRLEPQNAEYWRQLGLLHLYESKDPEAALDALHRATELNPRDADSWIGIAYAEQLLANANAEQDAVSRATLAEPRRLAIAWQAANLYAVLGDRQRTMIELCLVMQHDPRRSQAARDLAQRLDSGSGTLSGDCDSQERKH